MLCGDVAVISSRRSPARISAEDWIEAGACTECPTPCPADLNGDGAVDGQDLAAVLAAWGLPCDE